MRSSALVALLVCATALAVPAAVHAQGWLKQMPSEHEVLAEIQGEDSLDTLARQSAAFHHLYAATNRLLGQKQLDPTRAQASVLGIYRTGRDGAERQALASVEWQTWNDLAGKYYTDAFKAEVLRTFLSKRLRARIAAIRDVDSTPNPLPPPPQPEDDPEFPKHILVGGIVLVLAAGALASRRRRYWDEW